MRKSWTCELALAALVGLLVTATPARADDEQSRQAPQRVQETIAAAATLVENGQRLAANPSAEGWLDRAETSLGRARILFEAGRLAEAEREALQSRAESGLHRATVAIQTLRSLEVGAGLDLEATRIEAETALRRAENRLAGGNFESAARNAGDVERIVGRVTR